MESSIRPKSSYCSGISCKNSRQFTPQFSYFRFPKDVGRNAIFNDASLSFYLMKAKLQTLEKEIEIITLQKKEALTEVKHLSFFEEDGYCMTTSFQNNFCCNGTFFSSEQHQTVLGAHSAVGTQCGRWSRKDSTERPSRIQGKLA
ncbi:hypothetical protein PoB_005250900 [Plakobranchus ocellatus]|uniref:Uncharacterized protein n=1 Tax=Plakobranchus ocellatus TaxID=259542 RepID=A0AAV4C4E8_9GAST|nr:hypothetical protein PoB_005250900 [Plakobranchus ocellatus]